MRNRSSQSRQRGLTLVEVLIALTVITLISVFVIGAVGPWLGLKQNIDNDRKLQDVRQALTNVYDSRAMAAEKEPPREFFGFKQSTIDGLGFCNLQASAFATLSTLISDSGQQAAKDGFGNPLCVFISPQLQAARDGATVYYRNIAIVSGGQSGKLEATTRMDDAGVMTFGGTNVGFVISGYDIQYPKLKETLRRLSRIANTYESYFSTRFLSYADRDITRDYFSSDYDTAGSVPSTGGNWKGAQAHLAPIGVSAGDAYSPWESDNEILVGNSTESMNGQTVRSPASTGTGTLPYTAILAARIPAPDGVTAYVTRVAVGNY